MLVNPVNYQNIEKPQGYNAFARAEEEFQLKKAMALAEAQARKDAADLKREALKVGGATGGIADRLIAQGVDPIQAVLIAKSGLGAGVGLDVKTGQVQPMMGAPEAKGALKYGETAGGKQAELQYQPLLIESKAKAEDVAKAKTNVGGYANDVANSIQLIDQTMKMPGFSSALGPLQSRLPTVRGTTADAEAAIKQIQGGAFLDSIQEMRGLGALSNAEGQAATQAATRMQTAISEDGFRKAAEEYKAIMTQGLLRMQRKAGVEQGVPAPAFSNSDPLSAARDAIARGAPRDAVIRRLQENGIDAAGL